MEVRLLWEERPPHKKAESSVACYSVAFSPDGCYVLCGVGERVFVFDRDSGAVVRSLKGHKATVYCVACSSDGKLVASGGSDRTVIVWSSKFEGLLKYTHKESVQCLVFNPITHQLVSGAATDFGVWYSKQTSVAKHASTSRVLSIAWTDDGRRIALGHLSGEISLRDAELKEQVSIRKSCPVWSLTWCGEDGQGDSLLAVACWDGRFCLHASNGDTLSEKTLGYCPCFLSPFRQSGSLITGGMNRQVVLVNLKGAEIVTCIERDSWIWTAAAMEATGEIFLAAGTHDGTVAVYKIRQQVQIRQHGDWLVQRSDLASINYQVLHTNEKNTMKFNQHVQNVAVYKNTMAVQTRDECLAFALDQGRIPPQKGKASVTDSAQLGAVREHHFYLKLRDEMLALDMDGNLFRSWRFYSEISLIGGPVQHESIAVGCHSGQLFVVQPQSEIPQLLLEHPCSIRAVDVDRERKAAAVVDVQLCLTVYDLRTQQRTWEVANASVDTVFWNRRVSGLLCYGSCGRIYVKTAQFEALSLSTEGTAVGFPGSTVRLLKDGELSSVSAALKDLLPSYVETADYGTAYSILTLGASESEWRELGLVCLLSNEMDVAVKCFSHVRDLAFLDCVEELGDSATQKNSPTSYLAELYCYMGRFEAAADCHARHGEMDKALDIFQKMKLHERGRKWAESYSQDKTAACDIQVSTAVSSLVRDQAHWTEQSEDVERACDLYIQARDYDRAFDLIRRHGWSGGLANLATRLGDDQALLRKCAELSTELRDSKTAEALLTRVGDADRLIELYCATAQWQKALDLAVGTEKRRSVIAAQAEWLVERDAWLDAVDLYVSCDRLERARDILLEVAQTSAAVKNFLETASLYLKLAVLAEDSANMDHFVRLADVYHAYNVVDASFRAVLPSTGVLFNVGQYLAAQLLGLSGELPEGVRLSNVLYILFKSAQSLGARRTAQLAVEQLLKLHLPTNLEEEVQIAALEMRDRQQEDPVEMHTVCCRCNETSENQNLSEDACPLCGAQFERCFLTFERLPIIEFSVGDEVDSDEAIAAAKALPDEHCHVSPLCEAEVGPNVLCLSNSSDSEKSDAVGPFATVEAQLLSRVTLDLSQLKKLPPEDVLISRLQNAHSPKRPRFFKILDHSVPLCTGPCGHIYIHEEYVQTCLEHGQKPFKRS